MVHPLLIERKLAVKHWWSLGLLGWGREAIGFEDETSDVLDLLEVFVVYDRLLVSIVV